MSEPEAAPPAVETEAPAPPVGAISARGILLGSGPRFARDSFGPILAFYVLYRTVGLAAGIVAATVVALLSVRHEKKNERSGAMARFSLVFVILQAVIGLASGSARVYLAQPVLLNGAMGLLFLGSALVGRPLAGVFADEMYPPLKSLPHLWVQLTPLYDGNCTQSEGTSRQPTSTPFAR